MSIIDNLVTDRTQSDVDRWKILRDKGWVSMTSDERSEWLSGMKGAYDPSIDMNRVTNAMEFLVSEFWENGYVIPYKKVEIENGRYEWIESDIPTSEQLEQYRKNVDAIRDTISVLETTPETPPSMKALDFVKANNIEKILVDINFLMESMMKVRLYANQPMLFCGFAVYTKKADIMLQTSDILNFYTSDGLPFYLKS